MKVLRFVLVLAFMFTFAISPAQAKAGVRYGFMPLLTKVSSASPLRVQAQQAFQRLLPQLRAAQKNGTILDFVPEFDAGILKIKYAASVGALKLGKMQAMDNINAAVALVPHTQSIRRRPEILTPTFYPSLYDSCYYAYGVGNASRVVSTLRDAANVIVASGVSTADVNGYSYGCFDWTGNNDVRPGYKTTYKIYDNTGVTLLGTFQATAPSIVFTGIDKASSLVAGNGPIGKTYSISWYHRNLDAGNTSLNLTLTGTISAGYTWQNDFGTTPFRAGDSFYMDVTQTANFIYERSFDVPYAYCQIGANYCDIYGFPNQAATLTITHAGTPYTFNGKFNMGGWFSGYLVDANGNDVYLTPGDTVTGTGIAAYALPSLTATVDYATNIVSGTAPINRFFWVEVYDSYNDYWYSVWAHSNPSGIYSANFTSQIDLKPTDALTIETYYRDPSTGYYTDRYFAVGP